MEEKKGYDCLPTIRFECGQNREIFSTGGKGAIAWVQVSSDCGYHIDAWVVQFDEDGEEVETFSFAPDGEPHNHRFELGPGHRLVMNGAGTDGKHCWAKVCWNEPPLPGG